MGPLGQLLTCAFTNNVQAIRKVTSLPPLGQSDHTMVGCSIDLSPVKSQPVHPKRRVFLYDNVDLALVNEARPSIGQKSQQPPLFDSAWHRWKSLFFSVVDKHIPSKLVGAPKNKLGVKRIHRNPDRSGSAEDPFQSSKIRGSADPKKKKKNRPPSWHA